MPRKIEVCPECDSAIIRKKKPRHGSERKHETAYACQNTGCCVHFDEPVVREAVGERPYPEDSLQERLLRMDPDEV